MKNKVFLFLVGMVAFSSLCTYLTVTILHLPCLVEMFLLPLAFYYRRTFTLSRIEIFMVICFIATWFLIGSLNTSYSSSAIFPIARCFLLGAIGFVLAKNNNLFNNIDNLYIFSFGVFIGDLINAYFRMNIVQLMGDKQYAVDINIIFSVLWVILTILYKRPIYLLLIFVLVPILSFLSVSRGITTFFIFATVLSFILKVMYDKRKIILAIGFLFISFFILSNLYMSSEEAVKRFSPSMHFRLYTKVKSYGENNIDAGRLSAYSYALDNLDYYILPRGFLGKVFLSKLDKNYEALMTPWDSAYMELLYTFGFVLLSVFVFIYLWKLYVCLILYVETKELIYAVSFAMLATIFLECFFTYGMIRSPFTVFCSAGILGFIWRVADEPESVAQYFNRLI